MRSFIRMGNLVFHGIGGILGFVLALVCSLAAVVTYAYVRMASWVFYSLMGLVCFTFVFFVVALGSVEAFVREELWRQSAAKGSAAAVDKEQQASVQLSS
jgi:hypothetical protein